MYAKSKPDSIQSMFDAIATNYDRTNAVLSFCMHHLWNAALVRETLACSHPRSLVDLCSGTGEIAFRSIRATPSLETVQLIDFSSEMLQCAKRKAENGGIVTPSISFIQADVQELPLASNSIDSMTMAYGIRNVNDRLKCLHEVARCLRPGGTFGILELTQPTHNLLKVLHTTYLKTALPLLGKLLTSNQDAYKYLCNSIHTFVKPATLKDELLDAGFSSLSITPLSGGIATLFIAKKNSH